MKLGDLNDVFWSQWEQGFKPSKLKSSIFLKSMCKCAIEDKLLSSVTIPVPYYGNYYAIFQVSLITKTVLSLPTSISSRTIVSLNKDRWKVSKPKQDLCWRNSVPCRYNWKDPRSLSQTKPVYPGAKGKRSGVCFLVLSACPF